jgi:hypothetical protein
MTVCIEREEKKFPYMTLLRVFGCGLEWCSEQGRREGLDYENMIGEFRELLRLG